MSEIENGILKQRAVRGIIALTTRTFFLQLISLFSFTLLTYYLEPAIIGVLSATVAATKIFTLFTDIGFGAALIQKKEQLTDEDLQTTFTLQQILVGLVVFLGLLFSGKIARYFNLSIDGLWLLRTLIFLLLVSSLKTIPSILMERKIQFEKQIIPQIAESLVFNILVVVLAVKGFKVASFSWAFLISSLFSLPLYYFLAPFKIRFSVNFQIARKILTFGTPYQLKSVLSVLKDDFLKLYAVKTIGLSNVGLLEWGQRWAFSPFRFVVDSVTKVTFPAFARLQEEKTALRNALETSLFSVSAIFFPLMVGMVSLAGYLVYLLPKYQKWEDGLVILYFFAINAGVSSLSNILVNVLDATGQVRTTLRLMIIWTVAVWILTPIGIYFFKTPGVAIASSLVTLSVFYTASLVKKNLPFAFFPSFYKPLFCSIVILIIMQFGKLLLGTTWISLIIVVSSGVIIYLGLMFIFARKEINNLRAIIKIK